MIKISQNKTKEIFIKDIVNELNAIPTAHLKTIYSIIHTFKESIRKDEPTDFWDNLTDWEKEDINAGIHDLENGQYKDIEQVLSKYI